MGRKKRRLSRQKKASRKIVWRLLCRKLVRLLLELKCTGLEHIISKDKKYGNDPDAATEKVDMKDYRCHIRSNLCILMLIL